MNRAEREVAVAEWLYAPRSAPWVWTPRAERIGAAFRWLAAFALVLVISIDVTP